MTAPRPGRRRPVLALAVMLLFALCSSAVFAQSGSAGGSLGKHGKSASGGEEQMTPRKPRVSRASSETSVPQTIHMNEHNATWGEFSATLTKTGPGSYEARWNHGLISQMKVTIGRDSMTMERTDISGAINPCHGHYSGTRQAGAAKAAGSNTVACAIGGASSTWDASW